MKIKRDEAVDLLLILMITFFAHIQQYAHKQFGRRLNSF